MQWLEQRGELDAAESQYQQVPAQHHSATAAGLLELVSALLTVGGFAVRVLRPFPSALLRHTTPAPPPGCSGCDVSIRYAF